MLRQEMQFHFNCELWQFKTWLRFALSSNNRGLHVLYTYLLISKCIVCDEIVKVQYGCILYMYSTYMIVLVLLLCVIKRNENWYSSICLTYIQYSLIISTLEM